MSQLLQIAEELHTVRDVLLHWTQRNEIPLNFVPLSLPTVSPALHSHSDDRLLCDSHSLISVPINASVSRSKRCRMFLHRPMLQLSLSARSCSVKNPVANHTLISPLHT